MAATSAAMTDLGQGAAGRWGPAVHTPLICCPPWRAFPGLSRRFMIDRLKTEAALWKREDGPAPRAGFRRAKGDETASARWGRADA